MTHSTHGDLVAPLHRPGRNIATAGQPGQPRRRYLTKVSHRSFRSTLGTVASGLAAVTAVSWVIGSAPAHAAGGYGVAGATIQAQEWWLPGLHVTQAWRNTEGAGITVAVLGTGVAAGHPDLAGSVSTGPDFTGSGRTAGGPFWGIDGTEVAGVIAGHGHGTGGEAGILGIAPAAKILSIRVSLEYNDPLNSDTAIARRLPAAIAEGITYAVDHGARVVDLPLDPGTAGLTGQGDPAAAGGSQAEQAAVAYALHKNVVLVAPAGDDALGSGLVNYPAAYPGVIAVGAVARDGQLAPFSSRHSYVSLTAPGVSLMAAVPPEGYARISSTSTSSGIVAGVAALILSRYPHLTVAQVSQALTEGTTGGSTADRAGAPGAGHGTVDAARAVEEAAAITSASQPRQPARPTPRPYKATQLATTAAHRASASALAGSLVRYVVAGLCVLIVLLVMLTLVMRSRRERARATEAEGLGSGATRVRPRGLHEQRRPEPGAEPGQVAGPGGLTGLGAAGSRPGLAPPGSALAPPGSALAPPGSATTGNWPAAGGWQGGSVGEIAHSSGAPYRPVMTPAPKAAKPAKAAASPSGPPWAPAPEPERTFGPLPVVANSALPPDPGPSIRVPGDMAALPAVAPDSLPPAPFDFTTSPDPDFPPRPAVGDDIDPGFPGLPNLTAKQNLDFAAAPVPADYAPPEAPDFTVPSRAAGLVLSAETNPNAPARPARPTGRQAPAADPGYIWDLAATDVFPAAVKPGPTQEAPGAVPGDGDPGATAS